MYWIVGFPHNNTTIQTVDDTLLQEVCPLYSKTDTGCCTDYNLNFIKLLLEPIKQVSSSDQPCMINVFSHFMKIGNLKVNSEMNC